MMIEAKTNFLQVKAQKKNKKKKRQRHNYVETQSSKRRGFISPHT